jgi:hypothetical protein
MLIRSVGDGASVSRAETVTGCRLNVTDLNLPTCGVAFLALFFTLHLKKPTGASVQGLRKSFDFIGL